MGRSRADRRQPDDTTVRKAAVAERDRNVLIDAGAGTGKTTILVDRLLNMLAPADGQAPLPIERVAAVTFTRRAAGELRLRVRERLLAALADPKLSHARRDVLRVALSGLDTAYIGTIHSFADRLLRLRPIEAGLSPSYQVVEDNGDLAAETFELLMNGAETSLAALLAGSKVATRAAEAKRTVLDAVRAGLRPESREVSYATWFGLDALVAGFIVHRDVPPADPGPIEADLPSFRRYVEELCELVEPLQGETRGVRWLRQAAEQLRGAAKDEDPVVVYRRAREIFRRPPDLKKRNDFESDGDAWDVWKALTGDFRKSPVRSRPLRDDLIGPLHRWQATRLVRLFPVVIELYERVKARHQALDQIDLLLKLRDLLANDLGARADYQSLFDHIFVDEFQDTDPLQAEILLFLCERQARATQWSKVVLEKGKLTIVGDPKQSIYRFRRADVAMYDAVRKVIANGPHLSVQLSRNYRSVGPLIDWFNDRFADLLGTDDANRLFDEDTGTVFHRPLLGKRPRQESAHVHVLPFEGDEDLKADGYRALEAEALAHYLRWLVERRELTITDPLSRTQRPVRYGDIAVLAISTMTLGALFPQLDRMGIAHGSRGGRLFLEDALHRRFLLGLRAIADRDDGVAEAVLLRPPFFALQMEDMWRWKGAVAESSDELVGRVRAAKDWIRDMRRRRFERAPGATARDLLENTGFGRWVALGPNGAQRLERLRELCLVLERTAAAEGLDYDAATAKLRDWVNEPTQLDPAPPVAVDAVQVMTVHQAKGLEFPVVVLWDGRALLDSREQGRVWAVERTGDGWSLQLDGLSWDEPPGFGLAEREKQYRDAERKRVVYVAATRARDLLVVPRAGTPGTSLICGRLLGGTLPAGIVEELDVYRAGKGARWSKRIGPPPAAPRQSSERLEQENATRWQAAIRAVSPPRFAPAGIVQEAHAARDDLDGEASPPRKREGRYGNIFGQAVHLAIGIMIREPGTSAVEAAGRAAQMAGLREHLPEVAEDAERGMEALRREGLLGPVGPALRLEYPIAGLGDAGKLLGGYIDLVAVGPSGTVVIDFKTDQPPSGELDPKCVAYANQVCTYTQLLNHPGLSTGPRIAAALLFTGDGQLRWVV